MDLVVTLTDQSKISKIVKYLKRDESVKRIVTIDAQGKKEVKLSNRDMVNSMFTMSSTVISKSLSKGENR
ncbi:MAG: hypothetical protein CVU05_02675 [Bacteroidetes bacterium HGW-Bacteroidetes-21]|jgi:hypothetical protein|nr:MAG: hypothetical protein CVU05_02675 [Bacteroidetes bacterium HGW-Bacteroidetes-21]